MMENNKVIGNECLIEAESMIRWLEGCKETIYQTFGDVDGLGDPNVLSQHVAMRYGMQRAYDIAIRYLRTMQGRVDE